MTSWQVWIIATALQPLCTSGCSSNVTFLRGAVIDSLPQLRYRGITGVRVRVWLECVCNSRPAAMPPWVVCPGTLLKRRRIMSPVLYNIQAVVNGRQTYGSAAYNGWMVLLSVSQTTACDLSTVDWGAVLVARWCVFVWAVSLRSARGRRHLAVRQSSTSRKSCGPPMAANRWMVRTLSLPLQHSHYLGDTDSHARTHKHTIMNASARICHGDHAPQIRTVASQGGVGGV